MTRFYHPQAPPAFQEFPCGCKHNRLGMVPGSHICEQHFKEDRRHFCPDWDYMLIDKDSLEFETCICFDREPGGSPRKTSS